MELKPNQPLNQILFGPPGTGKTYNSVNKALEVLGVDITGKTRNEIKKLYVDKVRDGQIVFTTFHQSMSYEDFIEGIKPETLNERVIYSVKPGIFKSLCTTADTPNEVDFSRAYDSLKVELSERESQPLELKTPNGKSFAISLNSNDNLTLYTGPNKVKQGVLTKENLQKQINGEPKYVGWEGYFTGIIQYLETKYNYSGRASNLIQNYVIIIDEINRGNVSQIFGELITLIEDDKRAGKPEAIEVELPYSKERFSIPANLYIIGTMNTADRSVEALDTALRRRFSFVEMPPKPELLAGKGFEMQAILETINKRIEKLLDKDHLIGHSFFINVTSLEQLKQVFQNKINPLLQEYFFGDFGKIGLVVGSGFFENQGNQPDEDADLFATFNDYDMSDLGAKRVYRLRDVCVMSDYDFTAALDILLKR
ncbi:MAG: hypothetical protein EOP48_01145 [Sphingobacteriales bacterium]|nr:MAG: hypothetical protein EOP48_01145 [Sphingobacteriales bacterium]